MCLLEKAWYFCGVKCVEFKQPFKFAIFPSIVDTLPWRVVICCSMDSILQPNSSISSKIALKAFLFIGCGVSPSITIIPNNYDTKPKQQEVSVKELILTIAWVTLLWIASQLDLLVLKLIYTSMVYEVDWHRFLFLRNMGNSTKIMYTWIQY